MLAQHRRGAAFSAPIASNLSASTRRSFGCRRAFPAERGRAGAGPGRRARPPACGSRRSTAASGERWRWPCAPRTDGRPSVPWGIRVGPPLPGGHRGSGSVCSAAGGLLGGLRPAPAGPWAAARRPGRPGSACCRRVTGYAPVHWSEWLGGAAGAALGWALHSVRGLSSEPMRLSFHQRILLTLICLGALPTAVAILGWGLTIRSATPAAGPRQALEEVGATGRALLRTLDSTDLAPREKAALAAHAATLNTAIGQFQRAETYGRYYYAGLGLAVFLVGRGRALRVGPARRPPLAPAQPADRGADRLDRPHPADGGAAARPSPAGRARVRRAADRAPRDGRRRWSAARAQEIEAERLRAFRETARRVAHEMRNPLTPIRLAVAQLARSPSPSTQEAIEVLTAESGRLEQLAREFTEFGRLPEGPAAQVDLVELLEELVRTSLPPGMTRPPRARSGDAGAPGTLRSAAARRSATSSATRWKPATRRASWRSPPVPRAAAARAS